MLTGTQVDELLRAPYSFAERPKPVPPDGRPIWRVPYTLLLVRSCRGAQGTLEQLHVLNWAIRTSGGVDQLARFLTGGVAAEQPVVRYEPALDRAVSLATGLGWLAYEDKKWRLTAAGADVLSAVNADEQLYAYEKSLLASVGRPLSQAAVRRLVNREESG